MATIVMADDGIQFDGRTPETRALGGAESAVVSLAEALAARGHRVLAFTNCEAALHHKGVDWAPLHAGGAYAGLPQAADLYIANRGHRLVGRVPGAKARAFWVHNPAGYLLKARYLWPLWRHRPTIVFIGTYHEGTLPGWVPDGGRKTIPYGTPEMFAASAPASTPPGARAIFTSNPLRGLDWLLDRWVGEIRPNVDGAELHIFSGAATYGAAGDAKADEMSRVLDRARSLAGSGVVLRGPVAKEALIDELRAARVMLYRGDINETYCQSVAEAQVLGVPAVVTDLGSMAERVADGETGYVVTSDADFSAAASRLLVDDALWQACHDAARARRLAWTWDMAAASFEGLMN